MSILTYVIGLMVVVFVYTLFMACWLDGHSEPPVPTESKAGQEIKSESGSNKNIAADSANVPSNQQGKDDNEKSFYDRWLVTIFTGGLLIVAYLQWRTFQQQTELTRYSLTFAKDAAATAKEATKQTDKVIERMDRDQRPWLSVRDPVLLPLTLHRPPTVQFEILNTGKTPGTIVSTSFHPYIVLRMEGRDINKDIDEGMADTRADVAAEDRQTSIAPNDTLQLEKVHPDDIKSELFLLSFNNGGIVIVFAGKVEYTDVTGAIHPTQCCYVYDVATSRFKKFHKHNYMK